jgi:protein-tyrosine phosphatase
MKPTLLFICTGNICRSPAAHAVMAHHLALAGLSEEVRVDSAGMGGWHAGELPDPRARREGARRGYRLDHLARAVSADDFRRPGLLLALDRGHERALQRMAPAGFPADRIRLLRSFDPQSAVGAEVADPYYGPESGFASMFDEIEATVVGLVQAAGMLSGGALR